jgi:DNA-directed RNA polymerase subunit RPC12/RpoP
MKFENLGNMLTGTGRLRFQCHACGREASWPAKQAIEQFGAWAPPYEVRDRVKCGGCGSKRVSVYV